MKIAVFGLPGHGKTTVFKSLTGLSNLSSNQAAVNVPDDRIDQLVSIYNPKKTFYAKVEYIDLGGDAGMDKRSGELGQKFLASVRPARALIHVIDGFSVSEMWEEGVIEAVDIIDTELVLSDLAVCEKRMKFLQKFGAKSGPEAEEKKLLEAAVTHFENGVPLRHHPHLANAERLKGYSFLSAKPMITVINTSEENSIISIDKLPESVLESRSGDFGQIVPICAQLESEIAELSAEESREFLKDYGIEAPARERIIRASYDLLGLCSYFTVGEDEVKAWTIPLEIKAKAAAGVIHSDMSRGFIRAEVVDFDTAMEHGGFEGAKKRVSYAWKVKSMLSKMVILSPSGLMCSFV